MTKQELINTLNNGTSEFAFIPVSKVIELVSSLEESNGQSNGILSKVKEIVIDILENTEFSEYVETDTADFSLYGNEIQLESVNFDSELLIKDLKKSIEERIKAEQVN